MYTILIILTICPNLILYLISVGDEIMMVHQLSPHFQIIHNWTRTSSNWKYYRVNKKEISTSASWTSDRMESSLDTWWNEEKKIPFLLYPEIGQGNPNRNDISDLHMEFFFCQMLISYSIDYNEHKTMIIRERSKIQIFSLSMIPINPFKFHCTFDNIESRYNRLVVSIAIFFSLFFFIFFSLVNSKSFRITGRIDFSCTTRSLDRTCTIFHLSCLVALLTTVVFRKL